MKDERFASALASLERAAAGNDERCRMLMQAAMRTRNHTYRGRMRRRGDALEASRMNIRCARSKRLGMYLDGHMRDGECVTAHGRSYSVTEDRGEWSEVAGRSPSGETELKANWFPGQPDRTIITWEAER